MPIPRFIPAVLFGLLLMAAAPPALSDVVISEFVASNQNGLSDEDGDTPDWIELYNNGTTIANLAGWTLTDDAGLPAKWTFPAVTIEPNGFMVVFASNKNHTTPGQVLHTNFKLSADGGYLALARADHTIATEFAAYPAQYPDKSYGFPQTLATTSFAGTTAPLKYFIPTDNALGTTWTARTFSDSTWTSGTNGVGFQATLPGFLFKTWFANVSVGTIAAANGVIATPSQQTSFFQTNLPAVNFMDTSAEGHYPANSNPSWLGNGVDHDNYVIEATGIIAIPSAGTYTFGVNSDDGFQLQVGPVGGALTTVCSFDGGRGAADTVGTFTFGAAVDYQIRVMVYEGAGGSGGEAFAAPGSKAAWDGTFQLIGDTANGGLAVRSTPAPGASSALLSYVQTNVQTSMLGVSPSAYLRYSFNVADPAAVTALSMPIRYDDGFIVWLNGTEVARRNAPAGTPTNASTATMGHPDVLGLLYETIDLTPFLGQLVAGTNVVAIQGLNVAGNDGDFLIQPEIAMYSATAGGENYLSAGTPAAFNTAPIYNKVAPVVASVGHGFFTSAQNVALTCGTPGATIRYTFDASTPSLANPAAATYSGLIAVNKTTVLRYAAFKAGAEASDVGTQTYIFPSDVITQSPTGAAPVINNPTGATSATTTWPTGPLSSNPSFSADAQILDYGMDPDIVNNATYSGTIINDLKAIPTFSIVTDLPNLFDANIGIWANPHRDSGDADPASPGNPWERAASVELIYPDGTVGFSAKCGLRLRGGYSRDPANPKHGLRCFFADGFGDGPLKYPLFGTSGNVATSFAKFDLRCSENYSWSYGGDATGIFIQDPLNRDIQIAMGEPGSHGAFYHLYINGQYWGLYNIDERPEANFAATYFGGNANDYDTIKVAPDNGYTIDPTDGDTNAWYSLWSQSDSGLAGGNTEAVNNTTYEKLIGRNPDGTANPAYPVLLDPVNLVDYMLCIYYGGNLDAAISNFLSNAAPNNFFVVRNRLGVTGGFKSMLHDSEHTFLNASQDRTGPWIAGSSASQGAATAFTKSSPQYIFQQCVYAQEFRTLFADRVYKHFYNDGVLTIAQVTALFDARKNEIDRAVVGESARWGDAKVTTPYTRDTWLAAINSTRNGYIPSRTSTVVGQFRAKGWYPGIDPPVFNQRGGNVPVGFNVTLTNPNASPAGQVIYYTLDDSDPRAYGGGIAAGAIAYTVPIVITTSKQIRTRIKSATEWSALDDVTFYPVQDFSGLIISELHYNPLPNGAISGDEYEFLELKNTSANTLDLGGLNFTSGVHYSFPTGTTLAPGGFYVLAHNATEFHNRYPAVTANGAYTGQLDDGGERITLSTGTGGTVIDFNYKDNAPWPAAADGQGFSLVTRDPNANPNADAAADWRASANIGGSPGADDPAVNIPPVLVNEVLTNSALPLVDSIELYNPTAGPVNIGDWWLSDSTGTPKKYRIPAGTIIAAGGWLTFTEAQFNATPGAGTSFALDQNGEQVYLYSGDAAGNLTGYSHGIEFAAAEQNVSFGRYLNSVGDESFPRQISRTFNAANSSPLVGPVVISEIMYAPYTGYDEFVEIRNIGGAPVALFDPANPTDTWRINGLGYNFPTSVTLPANGLALVVAMDPAAFRTKYSVPAAVPIFGPYSGSLQDNGERISLEAPAPPVPPVPPAVVPTVPYIVIDSVHYHPTAPWPPAAAGTGPSLQRLTLGSFADDPANWFASGSTPGLSNATNAAPSVAITAPANNANVTLPANVTFTASATDSDGTILKVEYYVDGAKVGESSTGPAFNFSWPAIGGIHTITAKAIDNGLSNTTSAPVTIFATTTVTQGLKAEYYSNQGLGGAPAGTRIDATVNFTDFFNAWPTNLGIAGMPQDHFSVRWSGQLFAPADGSYTITTVADDGVRLYFDGVLAINRWSDGSATNNYTIALTANTLHTVVMEYYENILIATAQLKWSGPGIASAIIPQARLYPNSTPIIITQPLPLTREVGTSATFGVFNSGTGLSYQWRKGGVNIPGATGATLTIPYVLPGDAGQYSVLISNSFGYVISTNAALTVTFTDTDGDGMQDAWEIANGFNPNSSGDAAGDADGDGMTNLQEFLVGTDPHNPASRFKLSIAKSGANQMLSFTAQPYKDYTLQYKNSLTDPAWTKLTDIPLSPTPQAIQFLDTTAAGNPTRSYRVVTPKQ